MLGSESLPEEAFGGCGIMPGTEQKVDNLTRGIDGPIEIIPLLLDLDLRLIDAVRVIGRGEMGPTALVEFGRIALDPPQDGGMVNVQPPLQHDFFQIAITSGVTQISVDAEHNDVAFEMAPFKQWGFAHGDLR